MRDLNADLEICKAATSGPWLVSEDDYSPIISAKHPVIVARGGDYAFADIAPEDEIFIAEARTGWEHAIQRALTAEKKLEELYGMMSQMAEEG